MFGELNMTRIISWNVNGIRAVLRKGFMSWLESEKPDLLCLQETKADPSQLDEELLKPLEYQGYFKSAVKKGYSGVVTYAREKPQTVSDMGVEKFDSEGRVVTLHYPEFSLVNAYFPNSQDERKRLPYKIAFCHAMEDHCRHLLKSGRNVIVCGDYNIAHTEIDLARPKDNENSAGYYIEERQAMTSFLAGGFVDTFRHFCPEPGHYTWWSYRTNARERNIGWRIDYFCVNKEFMPQVEASYILPEVTGSDHCPIVLELK